MRKGMMLALMAFAMADQASMKNQPKATLPEGEKTPNPKPIIAIKPGDELPFWEMPDGTMVQALNSKNAMRKWHKKGGL
jgi:hypothetical protein